MTGDMSWFWIGGVGGDTAAEDAGERLGHPRLFSAGVGELHKRLAAGLQPLFGCTVGSFANCHRKTPLSSLIPRPATFGFLHNAGVVRATRSLTISRL